MMEVELLVGERHYYVSLDRIKAFPDSYFAVALSPQWQQYHQHKDGRKRTKQLQLRIEDCKHIELFEHIVHYVQHGCVARNREGDCLIDRSLLASLREDADYFCLSGMVSEIDALMTSDTPMFNKIRDTIVNGRGLCGRCIGSDIDSQEGGADKKSMKVYRELSRCLKKGGTPFAFSTRHNAQDIFSIQSSKQHKGKTEQVQSTAKKAKTMQSLQDILKFYNSQQLHALDLRPSKALMDRVAAMTDSVFDDSENSYQHFTLQYQRLVVNTATQMSEKVIVSSNAAATDSTSGCVIVMVACGLSEIEAVVAQPNSTEEDVFNCKLSEFDSRQHCYTIAMREDCQCEFKPITEGVQLLFIYDIVTVKDDDEEFNMKDKHASRCGMHQFSKPHLKTLLAVKQEALHLIQNIINSVKLVGIYLSNNYLVEGLRESALTGFDTMLYNALKDTGVPISLVYVMRNATTVDGHGGYVRNYVNLLSNSYDNILEVHKVKNSSIDIPFVGCGGRGESWSFANYYAHKYSVEVDNTIYAAMIIGEREELQLPLKITKLSKISQLPVLRQLPELPDGSSGSSDSDSDSDSDIDSDSDSDF